jgi:nicotinamide mononucleotide transporter
MGITAWLQDNYIEVFGAVAGVIYVLLEIRQNIWLWPLGIITSAVYISVFFTSKFYADMSLQGYYLVISVLGWYWWSRGRRGEGVRGREGERERGSEGEKERGSEGEGERGSEKEGEWEKRRRGEGERGREEKTELVVTRLKLRVGIVIAVVFLVLFGVLWIILSKLTDSPVAGWDAFITSLSVVATWMLARKIYEHWYFWVVVNTVSAIIFFTRGLYPTMILYVIYGLMSFIGMIEWRKSLISTFEVENSASPK